MTMFVYAKEDGSPDISETKLNLDLFPGYTLVSVEEVRPHLDGKCWNGMEWLDRPIPYNRARARAYPPIGDQLDALWKALGPILEHPEAEAMLRKIMEVKSAHPKPTNKQ